jgi:desulfoferrodoxin (superoxide reductase-like protein)
MLPHLQMPSDMARKHRAQRHHIAWIAIALKESAIYGQFTKSLIPKAE